MTLDELRLSLPAPHVEPDARRRIRARLLASGRRIAVIDDDPTGTQTAHGARVFLDWERDAMASAVRDAEPLFFVSTNSRSLDVAAAAATGKVVGERLARAAAEAGTGLSFVSRSDSTLRGHFPGEVTALAAGAGIRPDAILLVPAFFEGGRFTAGDVHWVNLRGRLLPAARTEFAKDPSFGFGHSDLCLWAEEKTGGLTKAGDVRTVSLDDIRHGGPAKVAGILAGCPKGSTVVVNAMADADLEVVVLGIMDAEEAGQSFLCRTAASFVKVRAGLPDAPLLGTAEIGAADGPCLFVIGSWVGATTRQLEALLRSGNVEGIEYRADGDAGEPADAARRCASALRAGRHAALFTSRHVDRGGGDFLARGAEIMAGLCESVRLLPEAPAVIVAKGGITSLEVARRALGARDALVAGQVLPGVPLWRLGTGARFPGIPYVVFPGNVGEDGALLEVLARVRP
jgi:uncharacterized protein YgbK (DUF1537 family)